MPMDEWEIHPDDLSPAQREVADLIGFENYLKLIDVYAAETIAAADAGICTGGNFSVHFMASAMACLRRW